MIINLEDYLSISEICFELLIGEAGCEKRTEDIRIEVKLISTENQEITAFDEKLETNLNAAIEAGELIARHLIIKMSKLNNEVKGRVEDYCRRTLNHKY